MANKTILSSFILLSISGIFSIISLVFFSLFNLDISRSHFTFNGNPLSEGYSWYILNSNIQMHYFPGFILYGISLLLTIAGIILFIVGLFRKTKNANNKGLLKSSIVIFVVLIAALLPISLLNLQFQFIFFLGLIYCILLGIVLIIANFLRKRLSTEKQIDKEIKDDGNTRISISEEQIDKVTKENNDNGSLINPIVIIIIVIAALFPISLFLLLLVGAIVGIILFTVNLFGKKTKSEEQIDKETRKESKTRLLENSFVIFVVAIALLLISLVYFIKFQEVILNRTSTIYIFNSLDLFPFDRAEYLLKISVFLSITGIILFAKYIFRKNKVNEPQ